MVAGLLLINSVNCSLGTLTTEQLVLARTVALRSACAPPGQATLVDLWARQNESVYVRNSANVDDDVQEKRYRNTLKWVVEPNAPRVSVLRMLSVQAAAHFADQSLGFVYLDANHGYRALLDDMEAYYPKLMAGGMLAGHDYINLRAFGVIKAVREFTQARGLSFVLTDPPTGR
mgnify:CR=1 FL=1